MPLSGIKKIQVHLEGAWQAIRQAICSSNAVQFVHHALLVQEPAEGSRYCALWRHEHDAGPGELVVVD